MSFFEVNGVPVDIAEGSQEDPEERIGGSARMFDGTLRWHVRARKRSFSLRTAELNRDDMDDLRADLIGGELEITGDWFSGTFRAELGAESVVPGDSGFFALDFVLREV